jgi:hypothetical protein
VVVSPDLKKKDCLTKLGKIESPYDCFAAGA